MNRADVISLEAGRETDVTVGYHVLDVVAPPEMYETYSTTWEAMRIVVERMIRLGWQFRLLVLSGISHAWFEKKIQIVQRPEDERPDEFYHASAATAPMAVCQAALLAVKGIKA